jgi:hypothetical protein
VTIAYLMKTEGLSLVDAYMQVKTSRPIGKRLYQSTYANNYLYNLNVSHCTVIVKPKANFLRDLKRYEAQLKTDKTKKEEGKMRKTVAQGVSAGGDSKATSDLEGKCGVGDGSARKRPSRDPSCEAASVGSSGASNNAGTQAQKRQRIGPVSGPSISSNSVEAATSSGVRRKKVGPTIPPSHQGVGSNSALVASAPRGYDSKAIAVRRSKIGPMRPPTI